MKDRSEAPRIHAKTHSREFALFAFVAAGVLLFGCETPEEPSSTASVASEFREGEEARAESIIETNGTVPPQAETVEEPLTPEALHAWLQDRFGDESEITVHEIAAVDREGERPGSRVHGEAVVEIAISDRRLLTMVVLMQYGDSRPIVWQDWIDICATRHRDVPVTNEPTPEALASFRSACRTVRAMTMSGAVEEPTTFRYGYVDPKVDRVWKTMLDPADSSEP